MNEAIEIDRLIPAWQGLRAEAPIGHIESEGDYQQITLIIEGTCKNLINDLSTI